MFPFTREPWAAGDPRRVALDPRVRGGRPTVAGTGIPTAVVAERHRAGDGVQEIGADLGLAADVEEAVRYEANCLLPTFTLLSDE